MLAVSGWELPVQTVVFLATSASVKRRLATLSGSITSRPLAQALPCLSTGTQSEHLFSGFF